MLSARERERDNKAKLAARDFFIQRKEEEEEEKNKRILGKCVLVCLCLLRSTGLNTWMSTSFFVGISSIIGFTSLTTSIVMGGFRRVKIDHMCFFDVFTFWNVDNRSFREKRFERLKERKNEHSGREGTFEWSNLQLNERFVRGKFHVELNRSDLHSRVSSC